MPKKYNFIDLFCGAGGLSIGLKQAGFNEVFALDFNKDAVETFKQNFPNDQIIHDSIENLTTKRLKELVGDKKIHLVAGGPPCQGFSTIGKGDPGDMRNQLFKHFVRVVRILKPEVVLFENVTGMVSKKNESVLLRIIQSFRRIGYELHLQVLDAHHFGVPQKRRRTIIVGTKRGISFSFPKPTHREHMSVTLGKTLDDLARFLQKRTSVDPNHDITAAQIKSKMDYERIKRIPEGGKIRYQTDELKYFTPRLRLGLQWDKLRENRLRENHYHRLDRGLPTPTINTNNHHYFHPTEPRKFTLREFACMQSFPMDYFFVGARTSVIRQIGNAVPPLLGKVLGKSLLKALATKSQSKSVSKVDYQKVRSEAFVYQTGA